MDESDEANDTLVSRQKIEINSPRPDLIVTDVTIPATVKIGDRIRLFAGFKNQGQADADKDDAIPESDEENNSKASPAAIQLVK